MSRLPDWLAERMALGEVPASMRDAAVTAQKDAEALQQVEALRQRDAAFLREVPPGEFAREIQRRLPPARSSSPSRRAIWTLASLVPAAALLFVFLRIPVQPSTTEREKGLSTQLVIQRAREGSLERLEPGARVRPGDVLQVSYVAAHARQGVVISLDGAGGVTLHWPRDQARSAGMTPGAEIPLPTAYRLDRAPRFERFFLISAEQPFEVATVLAAAQHLAQGTQSDMAPLALPRGLEQTSQLLEKSP